MQWSNGEYTLTDESARTDLKAVSELLHSTYWAAQRKTDVIEKSLRHSLNFNLFWQAQQIGFARIITDYATHAYLCDVVIAEEHRGKGVGKWMLQQILNHPQLSGCRIDLFTRSAQEFYRAFGFGHHKDECLVRYPPGYAGGNAITQSSS